MRILIFTKTNWAEPPRIRHQIARLLRDQGHKVVFCEKSDIRTFFPLKREEEGVTFYKYFELMHHQLRPFQILVNLNKFIAKKIISKLFLQDEYDLVINFNYDYNFLQDLFPNKKIITLINDNFIAQGKPWMKKMIERQLGSTCKNSDTVLCVSKPLVDLVKKYNLKTQLFLPWAEVAYQKPVTNDNRNTVLYWGYINNRIKWDVIEQLLYENIKLLMVGPIDKNINETILKLTMSKNIEFLTSRDLSEINLSNICCSLLPYDLEYSNIHDMTFGNRGFKLLSYGLPLIFSNIPNLIEVESKIMQKSKSIKEYLEAIKYCQNNFDGLQNGIEDFLIGNYGEDRYKQLMGIINE